MTTATHTKFFSAKRDAVAQAKHLRAETGRPYGVVRKHTGPNKDMFSVRVLTSKTKHVVFKSSAA